MANGDNKTGHGIVTEVSPIQTTKTNRKFFWVNFGDDKYSCWDIGLRDKIQQGASIRFEYTVTTGKQGGEFKNILSVDSDNGRPSGGNGNEKGTVRDQIERQKSLLIAYESALKSAVETTGGGLDNYEKGEARADVILKIAPRYAEFILRALDEHPPEPEPAEPEE